MENTIYPFLCSCQPFVGLTGCLCNEDLLNTEHSVAHSKCVIVFVVQQLIRYTGGGEESGELRG